MHTSHRTLVALSLAVLLAGCGKSGDVTGPTSNATPTSADEAEVSQELARHPELVDDELSASEEQTDLGLAADSRVSLQAAIQPLFFWRSIRDVDRRLEFAFSDPDENGRPTTAIVTIHKRFRGAFNIVVASPEASPSPEPTPVPALATDDPATLPSEGTVIHKPLADHWVRRVLLKRVRVSDSGRELWKIVASSGVEVTSRDASTRIESLRVQAGDLDTTITDPLAFHRLRRLIRLDPSIEVRLTVTTLRSDDVVLLYLRGRRARFHNNGDNTYSGAWQAPAIAGLHHVGINALSHGTLFDDEAPYDSQAWILPYLVKPMAYEDYLL